MSTICAGQLVGMSRAAALEFSFFLSMPTMAMATLWTLYKSIHGGKDENPIGVHQITPHQWVILAIGFVVSFIVAYGAVAWFMSYVRKRGFAPFAIYRIVIGIAVLAWAAGMLEH
jgi:undecaprenyl-diphosphatase